MKGGMKNQGSREDKNPGQATLQSQGYRGAPGTEESVAKRRGKGPTSSAVPSVSKTSREELEVACFPLKPVFILHLSKGPKNFSLRKISTLSP